MYDYFEPDTQTLIENVTLIKEDNRRSEQTFGVTITFGDPGAGIRPATLKETAGQTTNYDYSIGGSEDNNNIVLSFIPFLSEVTIPFILETDSLPEGTEGFRATIASAGAPFPNFQLPLLSPLPAIPAYENTLIRVLDDECESDLFFCFH